MSVALAPPEHWTAHAEPWTVEDFYAILPEGNVRFELYDGAVIVNAMPSYRHQQISFELIRHLVDAAPPELVAVMPSDVAVPAGILVPDAVVLPREVAKKVGRPFPADQVLLVVEVESPYSRRRDRILKAGAYAEAGIPSYWRVELNDDESEAVVVAQELRGGTYVESARLVPGDVGRVVRPFPVALDPAGLLR